MKLSIVIPVYNVEKYVEKCIRSCERQNVSPEDYEVIVVNDGSPDGSLAVVERVAADYTNIRVISQQNQGLSAARNTGIDVAKGEYIWFVDSDDWIAENCLGDIFKKLTDNLDLLQIGFELVYDDASLNKESELNEIDGITDGVTQTIKGGLYTPGPFVIHRRQYLNDNNLRFKEGIFHEDGEFRPRSILPAKKIASLNKVCYYYYQRNGDNIMSSFKEKNIKDIFGIMLGLMEMADKQSDKVRIALYEKIGSFFNTLLNGLYHSKFTNFEAVKPYFKSNRILFNRIMKCNNLKYKIEAFLFLLNVDLGYLFYKIIKKYAK